MEKKISLFLAILTLGFAQQIFAQDENASADDTERWSDFLPLNKEMAGDADLPLPFGIGVTCYGQKQDMSVNSIKLQNIDISGLSDVTVAPGFTVSFAGAEVYSTIAEATKVDNDIDNRSLRLDAWLFPFLNVYGVLGTIKGKSTVSGGDTLDIKEEAWATDPNPVHKETLDRLATGFEANGFPFDYEGDVYGIGFVLAGGFRQFWGTVDVNFNRAELDGSASEIDTVTVTPRIGINGEVGGLKGSLWIGSMHQDVEENQIGQIETSVPDLGAGGSGTVPVSWDVLLEQKNEWNFLVGGSLNLTEHLDIAVEGGFGDREQVMGSLTFRF
jgi:hypothetical protein